MNGNSVQFNWNRGMEYSMLYCRRRFLIQVASSLYVRFGRGDPIDMGVM